MAMIKLIYLVPIFDRLLLQMELLLADGCLFTELSFQEDIQQK